MDIKENSSPSKDINKTKPVISPEDYAQKMSEMRNDLNQHEEGDGENENVEDILLALDNTGDGHNPLNPEDNISGNLDKGGYIAAAIIENFLGEYFKEVPTQWVEELSKISQDEKKMYINNFFEDLNIPPSIFYGMLNEMPEKQKENFYNHAYIEFKNKRGMDTRMGLNILVTMRLLAQVITEIK